MVEFDKTKYWNKIQTIVADLTEFSIFHNINKNLLVSKSNLSSFRYINIKKLSKLSSDS